jgi:glutamate/aspartate transport system substrate-binding protein
VYTRSFPGRTTESKIAISFFPQQANGALMGAHSFAGLRARCSLRLAALVCAIAVSTAVAAAESPTPSDSRLKTIIAKKVIRIAYRADARPFSFLNDAKEPLGYTIDLCKQVTTSIAEQFKIPDLKIEWVPVTVETRFSAIAGNKADIECGSSTVTLSRMKEVDFSNLVFVESTGILVSRTSNIRGLADLTGKKIALVSGTSNERAISNIVHQLSILVTLVPVKDRDEGVAALEGGQVDAFASDKLLLAGAKFKDQDALTILPDDFSIEQYAIVLPRGDWALRLAVNTGLAQIYRSGRTKALFERWFFGARPGLLLDAVYALGRIAD